MPESTSTKRDAETQTESKTRSIATQTRKPGQLAFDKVLNRVRGTQKNPPAFLQLNTRTAEISSVTWDPGDKPSVKAIFVKAALSGRIGPQPDHTVRARDDSLTVKDIVDIGKLRGSEIGVASSDSETGFKVIGGPLLKEGQLGEGVAASVSFLRSDRALFHTHPTEVHRETSEFRADVSSAGTSTEFAVNQRLEAVTYDKNGVDETKKLANPSRIMAKESTLGVRFLNRDSSDPNVLSQSTIRNPRPPAQVAPRSTQEQEDLRATSTSSSRFTPL